MGKIVRAPETWERTYAPGVFLAGGISNCADWQEAVAQKISQATNLDVINPRRYNWNMDSQSDESVAQIEWEYQQIHDCEYMLFWFCEETLCPITLYELGMAVSRREICRSSDHVPLVVGVHPNYQRKLDVYTQVGLHRPEVTLYEDLDFMVDEFIAQYEIASKR